MYGGVSPCNPRIAATPTSTFNTTLVEAIDARVVDADGKPLPTAPLRVVSVPDSVANPYGGGVQCRRNGVAQLLLTSRTLHSTMWVRCDLVARIESAPPTCLHVGDPPRPYTFTAYDAENRAMSRVRLRIANYDTTVVRYADGMVTALRPGRAMITVSAGRNGTATSYRVRARGDTSHASPC